jgi:SAM-dependent methyltransferase
MPPFVECAWTRPHESLPRLFFRQAWAEFMVSWRKSVSFRKIRNAEALRAYCSMTTAEFEGINARQQWANWRTIPRNILGRVPDRPCRAVDLCAGVGHSTQVLAYYLPPGSEILGLEYNPEFVAAAGRREYRGAGGERVKTDFRSQSVLETFRDPQERPLADESVDLVNSCGALGIHFDAAAIHGIAAEVFRVLKPGGLATVDSGTQGVGKEHMIRLFAPHGFQVINCAKSCFLDRFTQVCFRRR